MRTERTQLYTANRSKRDRCNPLAALGAGGTEALQIAPGSLARLGNWLAAMLLHEVRIAALVVLATVAIAVAGLHAETNFCIARRAGSAEGADLIGCAVVLASVFGFEVAGSIRIGHGKETHADRFIRARSHVTTDDRAVAAGAVGIADAITTGRAIGAERARVANLVAARDRGKCKTGEECGSEEHGRRILPRGGLVASGTRVCERGLSRLAGKLVPSRGFNRIPACERSFSESQRRG